MLLLGIDVETTGLSPKDDSIIELGAVLYDTKYEAPVAMLSALLKYPDTKPLEPVITKITGICDEMLKEHGQLAGNTLENFMHLVEQADYLVAHNVPFDKSFLEVFVVLNGACEDDDNLMSKHWIDTSVDLPIDKELCRHTNLLYLAAYHGIINPFSHRAVTDVLTMLQVLSKYDIDTVIGRSKSPAFKIWCTPGFHGKDAPKAAGFRYNPEDKSWFKNVKEYDLDFEMLSNGTLYDFDYKWTELNA